MRFRVAAGCVWGCLWLFYCWAVPMPLCAHAMLPAHSRRRSALRQLESQRDLLQQQLEALQQQHISLQQQHEIVSALCDSLLYIRPPSKGGQQTEQQKQHNLQLWEQQQQQHQQDGMAEDLALQQRVLELFEAEGQLLGRLQSLPSVPVELLRAASVDGQGLPTIAPADDPMALFKDLTSRPLYEAAHSMTSTDVILLFKQTVADMAMCLAKLDASLVPPEACAERVKQSSDRLLHCLTSCVLLDRHALTRAYATTNAETLGEPDAAALTNHAPTVVAAVSKLQLTPAQQQAIAGHWQVWRSLLAPVDAEIAQLQQQIQELCCQDCGAFCSSGSGSSSGTASDASSGAAAAALPDTAASDAASAAAWAGSVSDRAAFVESQMRLADRLQLVLRKKHGIVCFACCAFFVGRLSWVQLARLVVLSWPFPVSFEFSCMAIAQLGSVRE